MDVEKNEACGDRSQVLHGHHRGSLSCSRLRLASPSVHPPHLGAAAAVAGVQVITNLYLERHLYVYDLVAAAGARSKGHGTALMSYVEYLVRREGCKYVALACGREREGALRFYERLGSKDRVTLCAKPCVEVYGSVSLRPRLIGGVDLRTPLYNSTGILDSVGVAHITIGPRFPLKEDEKIVPFGYSRNEPEVETLARRFMPRYPVERVRQEPEKAAAEALAYLGEMAETFVGHCDVDVIDFGDFPVADVPQINAGLKFREALALRQRNQMFGQIKSEVN